MAQLLGLRIKNYRALADLKIGRILGTGERLPSMCVFIGPNGSGKSTLLDALGFVADCLVEGVEVACDKPQRGGFSRLRTQGKAMPIEFELIFGEADRKHIDFIHYHFALDEINGQPQVVAEALVAVAASASAIVLRLQHGNGDVLGVKDGSDADGELEAVQLANLDQLAIATLGNLKAHPRIVKLRDYLSNWYLSYFVTDAVRMLPVAGAHKHLDRTGSNVGNVLLYLQRAHPEHVKAMLERVRASVPGLKKIDCKTSDDGRLLLRFSERGYEDPFYQQSMSDGTLKLFTYFLLLNHPEPRPFIGIEEPENGLYPHLLERLSREMRHHARGGRTQVFVTTHSPSFVDGLTPEEVWVLGKGEDGFVHATRAADMPQVRALTDEGLPLGSLWSSNHLGDALSS